MSVKALLNEYLEDGYVDSGYVVAAEAVTSPYPIIFSASYGTWNCSKYPTNSIRSSRKVQPDLKLGGGTTVGASSIKKLKYRRLDLELLTKAEVDLLFAFFDLADGIQKQFTITDNVLGGAELVTFDESEIEAEATEADIYKATISLLLV